jgi:hypothetical protein
VLPVNTGCTCRARVRLFSYLANIKLTECTLKDTTGSGLCLDSNKAICGTPYISTDIFLRNEKSSLDIELRNLTLNSLIPVNGTGDFLQTFIPTNVKLNMIAQVKLGAPPVTLETCNITMDNNPCISCAKCTNPGSLIPLIPAYNGFVVNCSNIKIAEITYANTSFFTINLPDTPTCIPLPL